MLDFGERQKDEEREQTQWDKRGTTRIIKIMTASASQNKKEEWPE